jgi:GxxExxY protein
VADSSHDDLWELTSATIGALIEVHRRLGPGLLESAYECCVAEELRYRRLAFERQVPIALQYRGSVIPCAYQADLVIDRRVLLELKAVERVAPIHVSQALTYLKLLKLDVALLVNFNTVALEDGIRRLTRADDGLQVHADIGDERGSPAAQTNPSRAARTGKGEKTDIQQGDRKTGRA